MVVGAGKEGGIGAVPINLRDLSIPLGIIRMDTPLELQFFQKLPISTAPGFLLRQKESLGQTCAELCVGCVDLEVIPVPLEQLGMAPGLFGGAFPGLLSLGGISRAGIFLLPVPGCCRAGKAGAFRKGSAFQVFLASVSLALSTSRDGGAGKSKMSILGMDPALFHLLGGSWGFCS